MIHGFLKKFLLAIVFAAFVVPLPRVSAEATCAMLTFSDNTRFYKIGGAGILSDLVLEKLVSSGKLSFKETKPLAGESVTQLYDEDGKMYKIINQCRATGNYNPVFEGRQFNTTYARSVDLAVEGDIVEPELVQQIGRESGVKYLIQGTIDNYGTGKGVDGLGTASMVATMLSSIPSVSTMLTRVAKWFMSLLMQLLLWLTLSWSLTPLLASSSPHSMLSCTLTLTTLQR